MRLSDAVYRFGGDLPAHLSDLRRQLPGGGAQARPEVLGIVSALEELDAVCSAALSGRILNADDRSSLVTDLGLARKGLGSRVVHAASPALPDFYTQLNVLAMRLGTAQGARSVLLLLGSVRHALAAPQVSTAAWEDVVEAFADPDTDPELCETRIRNLRELTEARGHFWGPLGLAHALEKALGDEDVQSLLHDGASDLATTEISERVRRCGALVADDPRCADTAVWFVLTGAVLERAYLRLGPVTLYARQLLPHAVRQGGQLDGRDDMETLPEMESWETTAESWLSGLSEDHVVLARVWLSETPIDRAPGRARAILESLIDIAQPTSNWRLYEGHMAWSGHGFWGRSFADPVKSAEVQRAVHPAFEGTDRALGDLAPRFVARLAAEDPVALEAVEDARWTIALARAATPAQRVALGTRALERTLGVAQAQRESWQEVTSRFLKHPWVRLTLRNELLDAAIAATMGMPGRHTANLDSYRAAHDLAMPEREPGVRFVDYGGLARIQERFGDLWAKGSLAGRMIRRADRVLHEAQAALDALADVERRFDLLLARTERQRNAVIHGTRPAEGSLRSIDDFLSTLNAYVAQESLRTAETGAGPLAQLEEWRLETLQARQRLEMGEQPLIALRLDDLGRG